jgi:hypothetical protein
MTSCQQQCLNSLKQDETMITNDEVKTDGRMCLVPTSNLYFVIHLGGLRETSLSGRRFNRLLLKRSEMKVSVLPSDKRFRSRSLSDDVSTYDVIRNGFLGCGKKKCREELMHSEITGASAPPYNNLKRRDWARTRIIGPYTLEPHSGRAV